MPVFLLHGTPGSRVGPRPRHIMLRRRGIRLISYDRPGYGGSERRAGRTVADAALDVEDIADHYGLQDFVVVGRSGGGPHALACAAILPDRVLSTAVLVGLAPPDAGGFDWYQGMGEGNVAEYTTVDLCSLEEEQALLFQRFETQVRLTQADPENFLDFIGGDLSRPDQRVVGDLAIRRQLMRAYAEALAGGAAGWVDDVLAFRRSWSFDVGSITVPVTFWHGEDDAFSPVGHTRWLAGQIPHARVELEPGTGHFGAVEVLPRILAELVNRAGRARTSVRLA